MNKRNILGGLVLSLGISVNSSAHEIQVLNPLEKQSDETYKSVMTILAEDARSVYDGCGEEFYGQNNVYSELISNCLEHYVQGGYLDFQQYNAPFFLGNEDSKHMVKDYINGGWIKSIFAKQEGLRKIFEEDLKMIVSEQESFFKIYEEGISINDLPDNYIRAYNLYFELKKYNYPIDHLNLMIQLIITKILN